MSKHAHLQLWNKFLEGNELAFSQLIRELHPLVFAFVLGRTKDQSLAEDLLQEMWLKVFERRDKVENVRAYLFTVVKNLLVDHYRRASSRDTGQRLQYEMKIDPQVNAALEEQELKRQVREMLNDLDHSIWELHVSGYDNHEIAKRLGIAGKTVANRKSMIKNRIKEKWK